MAKVLKYLTSPDTGCCNVAELMELTRSDKANGTHHVDTLKQYTREEMTARGIVIDGEEQK